MKTFTEQTIQKLTNEKSFVRGKKYYESGRVTKYTDKNDMLEAVVVGTDKYKVSIDLSTLDMDCDCPAFRGVLLCKHQVAVLLMKIHGEVKTVKKPKVKKSSYKSSTNDVISKNEVRKVLQGFSKDQLIDNLSNIIEENQSILRHFTEPNKRYNTQYYKELQKSIRSKFRGVSYRSNWNSYVNRLDSIYFSVVELVKFLPNDKATCQFLLEQAYWIEEKQLTRLDDSDGIISSLSSHLIAKAVQYLNYKKADLGIIFEFTARESSFDYGVNIIHSIYESVKNSELLQQLGHKIEKTMYKRDSDFNFDNKYLHTIYLKYLAGNNFDKFRELAEELYESDISVYLLLIKTLYENEKYDAVIKYGWDQRDRWDVNDFVKKSLVKLEKWNEYISFLEDELLKNFELAKLKELKSLIEKHGKKRDWDKFLEKIKNMNLYKSDAIDFALFLKDFNKVYNLLTENNEKDYRGNVITDDIESFAVKLLIIHPDTALKLYIFLVENELEKFKGYANRYDKFFEFLQNIRNLGEKKYIEKVRNIVVSEYPSKKKLVERMKDF